MAEPRSSRHGQTGALAVEAAYVLPVVIAAGMMCIELANVGLTINMGSSALERAVQQFRRDDAAQLQGGTAGMKALLRQRMADASHNYLTLDNIAAVDIERFANLDALGGGNAAQRAESRGAVPNAPPIVGARTEMPAWRISVDIRKDFITPLPQLLGVDSSAFRYRYEHVLSYLPQETTSEQP